MQMVLFATRMKREEAVRYEGPLIDSERSGERVVCGDVSLVIPNASFARKIKRIQQSRGLEDHYAV